jgi:hypothetical protein
MRHHQIGLLGRSLAGTRDLRDRTLKRAGHLQSSDGLLAMAGSSDATMIGVASLYFLAPIVKQKDCHEQERQHQDDQDVEAGIAPASLLYRCSARHWHAHELSDQKR